MYGRCQSPELQQRPSTAGVAIPGIGAQVLQTSSPPWDIFQAQ